MLLVFKIEDSIIKLKSQTMRAKNQLSRNHYFSGFCVKNILAYRPLGGALDPLVYIYFLLWLTEYNNNITLLLLLIYL